MQTFKLLLQRCKGKNSHKCQHIEKSVGLPGKMSFMFCQKINKPIAPLHRGSMHIYRMAKAIDVEDLSPGKCLSRIDNRACLILCLSGMIIVCFLVIEQAGLYLK